MEPGESMKSISVHGLSGELVKAVEERAKKEGKSVNKIVKELIAKALGIGNKSPDNKAEFADLCGVWTESEADEFLGSIADLESVDEGDWR
jgi:hypothetical protein